MILVTARSSHNLRAEETKGKMWGYQDLGAQSRD